MQNYFGKRNTIPTCLIFVSVFFAFLTFANDDEIKNLDKDQDGLISIKESVADPNLLAIFGTIDRDSDGFLSKNELEQFAKAVKRVKVASTQ
jgi:Ca2+-binding EF-hand superfamily protein